jgi:hypothetical protein
MHCTGLLTGTLNALADSDSRFLLVGLVLWLCWLHRRLRSVPIQQITCFGSGTLAITCHAKSRLNRDDWRLPFGVGLLLFSGPVSLTIDALSCCDRCLLTVNLFRSIASAFGRCSVHPTPFVIVTSSRCEVFSVTVVLLGSFRQFS